VPSLVAIIPRFDALRSSIAQAIQRAGAAATPLSGARLLAPIPRPPRNVLCVGKNYHEHAHEFTRSGYDSSASTAADAIPTAPIVFTKAPECVIADGADIRYPTGVSDSLDYEAELAVVIGRPGRGIAKASAYDHVFGYTIVNDVTARDRQVRRTPEGMTWYELGSGKAFDSGAPLGPCIVTADEIGDPQNLKVRSRINGELRQSSNTSNMIWTCAELIHFFSRNFTLKPGMVIITGTPAGTAWSADKELGGKGVMQPGLVPATRYCLPGDIVECEVEKIGVLRNPIARASVRALSIAAE
jgi:2-keto-4-pentenoate hydratase/2-oxohepta-3-ene-1,7-dioic acid hydratase in catechol pathway